MNKYILLLSCLQIITCNYVQNTDLGYMIDTTPTDFKLTSDYYCGNQEKQEFGIQVRIDGSDQFFDDPSIQFELEFFCSHQIEFEIQDFQNNVLGVVENNIEVFLLENGQSLIPFKQDSKYIFQGCTSFPSFNYNIVIDKNADTFLTMPNIQFVAKFLMTNDLPTNDPFAINVQRKVLIQRSFEKNDTLINFPIIQQDFTKPFEISCFQFKIENNGCYQYLEGSIAMIEPYNEDNLNTSLVGFENYKNCELQIEGIQRVTNCERQNNSKIIFKDLFTKDDKGDISVKICDYIPQISTQQFKYLFTLQTFDMNQFYKGVIEIEVSDYIQNIVNYNFVNTQFNEDFELDINIDFSGVNFSTLKELIVLLEIPSNYPDKINSPITLEINNSNNQKTEGKMIVYSENKTNLFLLKREVQSFDQQGINFKVKGFKIPEILGNQQFTLRLQDSNSHYDILSRKLIIQPIVAQFNAKPNFQQGFSAKISSTNLNSIVDAEFMFEIPAKEQDKLLDIYIELGTGIYLDKSYFKGIINLSDSIYQDLVYEYSLNSIKIIGAKTKKDQETFFNFKLQGLKTSYHTTGQQFIKIDVYDSGQIIETFYDYYTLDQINIQIQKSTLKVLENNFELSFQFTIDNDVNFPNYLRINLEKSFYLQEEVICIKDSNLPIQSQQEEVICKLGQDTLNDEYNENHNILIDNGLSDVQQGNQYFLTVKGDLTETLSKNQVFKIDIIPKFQDQKDLEKFLRNSQSISNINQYVVELNCPLNCLQCYSSSQENLKCFQCIEDFVVDQITQKCMKIQSIQVQKEEIDQSQLEIINYGYLNVVEKIFIGLFSSFLPCILIIGLFLKKIFKKNFNILIYFVVLETILQYLLNYFLLLVSWNFVENRLELSLMNIFIGCFVIFNVVFCLIVFNRKNDMIKNIRIFGLSSNSFFLILFYCLFGSGSSLWIVVYKFSKSYHRIFLNDNNIKKSKNMIKLLSYVNLISFLSITTAAGILFFLRSTSNSRIKYFYLINGLITCSLYFLILTCSKKNEKFSFNGQTIKTYESKSQISYSQKNQDQYYTYKYINEEQFSETDLSIESCCSEIRPYIANLKEYYETKSQCYIQLRVFNFINKMSYFAQYSRVLLDIKFDNILSNFNLQRDVYAQVETSIDKVKSNFFKINDLNFQKVNVQVNHFEGNKFIHITLFEKLGFKLGEIKLEYETIKKNLNIKSRYTLTNCMKGILHLYLSFNIQAKIQNRSNVNLSTTSFGSQRQQIRNDRSISKHSVKSELNLSQSQKRKKTINSEKPIRQNEFSQSRFLHQKLSKDKSREYYNYQQHKNYNQPSLDVNICRTLFKDKILERQNSKAESLQQQASTNNEDFKITNTYTLNNIEKQLINQNKKLLQKNNDLLKEIDVRKSSPNSEIDFLNYQVERIEQNLIDQKKENDNFGIEEKLNLCKQRLKKEIEKNKTLQYNLELNQKQYNKDKDNFLKINKNLRQQVEKIQIQYHQLKSQGASEKTDSTQLKKTILSYEKKLINLKKQIKHDKLKEQRIQQLERYIHEKENQLKQSQQEIIFQFQSQQQQEIFQDSISQINHEKQEKIKKNKHHDQSIQTNKRFDFGTKKTLQNKKNNAQTQLSIKPLNFNKALLIIKQKEFKIPFDTMNQKLNILQNSLKNILPSIYKLRESLESSQQENHVKDQIVNDFKKKFQELFQQYNQQFNSIKEKEKIIEEIRAQQKEKEVYIQQQAILLHQFKTKIEDLSFNLKNELQTNEKLRKQIENLQCYNSNVQTEQSLSKYNFDFCNFDDVQEINHQIFTLQQQIMDLQREMQLNNVQKQPLQKQEENKNYLDLKIRYQKLQKYLIYFTLKSIISRNSVCNDEEEEEYQLQRIEECSNEDDYVLSVKLDSSFSSGANTKQDQQNIDQNDLMSSNNDEQTIELNSDIQQSNKRKTFPLKNFSVKKHKFNRKSNNSNKQQNIQEHDFRITESKYNDLENKNREFEDQIELLKNQKVELKQNIENYQKQIQDQQDYIEQLNNEINELQKENQNNMNQLQILIDQKKQQQKDQNVLRQKLEKIEAINNSLNQQNLLSKDLEDNKTIQFQQLNQELIQAKLQNDQLQDKVKGLEYETINNKQKTKQLKTENQKLIENNDSLESQNKNLLLKINNQKKEQYQKEDQHQKLLQQNLQIVQLQKKQNSKLQSQENEIQNTKKQFQEENQKNISLNNTIEELKIQLTKSSNIILENQKTIKTLEQMKSQSQKNFTASQEKQQLQINNLQSNVSKFSEENKTLQKKIKFLKKKIIGYQTYFRNEGANDSFNMSIQDSCLSKQSVRSSLNQRSLVQKLLTQSLIRKVKFFIKDYKQRCIQIFQLLENFRCNLNKAKSNNVKNLNKVLQHKQKQIRIYKKSYQELQDKMLADQINEADNVLLKQKIAKALLLIEDLKIKKQDKDKLFNIIASFNQFYLYKQYLKFQFTLTQCRYDQSLFQFKKRSNFVDQQFNKLQIEKLFELQDILEFTSESNSYAKSVKKYFYKNYGKRKIR